MERQVRAVLLVLVLAFYIVNISKMSNVFVLTKMYVAYSLPNDTRPVIFTVIILQKVIIVGGLSHYMQYMDFDY